MDGKSVASRQVRDIRSRTALSQRALAALAGVPQPTIAEIEAGRREPSITLLSRLAEAAGYELKLELEPLLPRCAVATANRVRARLVGAEGEGWSPALREDAALRAVIDFKDALSSSTVADFTRLVDLPPSLIGDTRWDAFIAAVVEDESATRHLAPPRWVSEKTRSLDRSGFSPRTQHCMPGSWQPPQPHSSDTAYWLPRKNWRASDRPIPQPEQLRTWPPGPPRARVPDLKDGNPQLRGDDGRPSSRLRWHGALGQ